MGYVVLAVRSLIAVVFLVSGATKLRGQGAFTEFADSIRQFGIVPKSWTRTVAVAVVAVELLIPLLLVPSVTVPVGLGAAGGLLVVFAGAILLVVRRGLRPPCRCFGASSTPLGIRHLIRNVVLAAVALGGMATPVAVMSSGLHPAGMAIAISAGAVLASLVVFFDDVVDLFADSAAPGVGPANANR